MSSDEKRRSLYKRQPTITKTYQPPYTSIRAKESEKLRTTVPTVKAPVLPEMEAAKPQIQVEGLTSAQLSDLSRQMQQIENQAQLDLKAKETAQRTEFEKDAKEALKKWKADETKNLDEQIEQALADAGITKADLQRSAKLRKQVTDWKRQNTANFKQKLAEAEWNAIQESKAKFAAAQREQRSQLKSSLATYEEKVQTDVQTQIKTQQNQIMKDLNWTGTWDQLLAYQKEQQKNISTLVARGTVKLEGNQVKLVKPVTALTDSEVALLNKIGMDVPDLPKGPSYYLYEHAEKGVGLLPKINITGKPMLPSIPGLPGGMNLAQQRITQHGAAMVGDVVQDLSNAYNLLIASWTGLPKSLGFEGPTTGTFKYYEDVSPAEQMALNLEGLGVSVAESFVVALPIGLTVKGATIAASSIASKIGVTAPKAVTKIAAMITKHPKIAQALVWAPMAGLETVDVYRQIQSGKPIDDIIHDEMKRLGSIYGGLKGFQKGYALLPDKKIAQIQRLIKIEKVQTPDGPQWIPTVNRKNIPKSIADHIATEIDPITGKEVLVGWITKDGVKIPVSRDFGYLLRDLVQGKTVGPDAVKGAILRHVTKEQYSWLLQRGYDIQKMTPDEIADVMLKELGWGTPYANAITTQRKLIMKGAETFDVVGAFKSKGKVLDSATRLFNELKGFGLTNDKASYWAGKILGTDVNTISNLATSLKLTESQTARLVEIWFENGGASKAGTALFQMLKGEGLNQLQIEKGISVIVAKSTGGEALASSLSKLDSKTMGVVSNLIDTGAIMSAVTYLPSNSLSIVIESTNPSTAAKIVSSLSGKALTGLATSISASAAAKVMPSLSTTNLNDLVVNMGGATLSKTVMELKPDQLNIILPSLSRDSWSTITPKLSPDALSHVVPNLSPEQLNRIIPNITPDQLNSIMPKFSTDQLNYTLEALDIPPELMLKYLQTGQLGRVEGVKPIVLKKLFDEKLKRNKREEEKQKTRMFEVILYHYNLTERFKVRADSFHGAARNALNRRHGTPIRVVVKVIKNN
jgi:hypothetical protein